MVVVRDAVTSIVADTADNYRSFNRVDINDVGQVVFDAYLDQGGRGVFVGGDPDLDKVIATGDPLFGSTVEQAQLLDFNNEGQVLVRIDLENNLAVICRADPVPEPT